MSVQIEGQGIDVGESLTKHVRSTIEALSHKYGIGLIAAKAVFSRLPHRKVSAFVMLEAKDGEFLAKKDGSDAYKAFETALADAERQMLKKKGKLRANERK